MTDIDNTFRSWGKLTLADLEWLYRAKGWCANFRAGRFVGFEFEPKEGG
jgi:hypothetical protein